MAWDGYHATGLFKPRGSRCSPRGLVNRELHQFTHGRIFDQVLRAAGGVVDERGVHVDAQVVVQRGEDFAVSDRAVGGVFAQAVGGADDLAGTHAAAGHEAATHRGPVVAARVVVDARRAAELAPG